LQQKTTIDVVVKSTNDLDATEDHQKIEKFEDTNLTIFTQNNSIVAKEDFS